MVQNGREVYKWVVSSIPKEMNLLAQKAKTNLVKIDWFIPHSANLKMIESLCEKKASFLLKEH